MVGWLPAGGEGRCAAALREVAPVALVGSVRGGCDLGVSGGVCEGRGRAEGLRRGL